MVIKKGTKLLERHYQAAPYRAHGKSLRLGWLKIGYYLSS